MIPKRDLNVKFCAKLYINIRQCDLISSLLLIPFNENTSMMIRWWSIIKYFVFFSRVFFKENKIHYSPHNARMDRLSFMNIQLKTMNSKIIYHIIYNNMIHLFFFYAKLLLFLHLIIIHTKASVTYYIFRVENLIGIAKNKNNKRFSFAMSLHAINKRTFV